MFLNMNQYNFDVANAANYRNAASGFIHYFHGVNPNTKTYLSNMGNYGAENSVAQFYHSWFEDGSALWDEAGVSVYGPAPGYIPGGPNPGYALDGCCPNNCGSSQNNALCNANVTPPMNQPVQKSYKDFNDGWPVDSWTVTEAGIYTNAAYVRMLAKFCSQTCASTTAVSMLQNKTSLISNLYPQPSPGKITIKFNRPEKEIGYLLYDLNGRELMSRKQNLSTADLEIDLSAFSRGVYFIKFISAGTTETKKVILE